MNQTFLSPLTHTNTIFTIPHFERIIHTHTAGEISEACEFYTKSIEVCPTAAVYGNLAQCRLKLETYGLALTDADKALELDPKYIKAYYRKGSAFMALGKFKDALRQFAAVVKAKPKSKSAKQKLKQCKKIIQRERFLKAIETEMTKPVSETYDLKSLVVPDTYDGPTLDDSEDITEIFVKQALTWMKNQKFIHKKFVAMILMRTIKYLSKRPTLMDISFLDNTDKFTVCGDTHGQFYDLLNIFKINGDPSPKNPYLFNGDFVDRGSFSVEVILTLFMYQLLHPKGMYLTRGNHETKNMNKLYGFEGEVKHKFDEKIMSLFAEAFQWLPLCAVIEKKVFVVRFCVCVCLGARISSLQHSNTHTHTHRYTAESSRRTMSRWTIFARSNVTENLPRVDLSVICSGVIRVLVLDVIPVNVVSPVRSSVRTSRRRS